MSHQQAEAEKAEGDPSARLKSVRLHLARCPEYPEGSADHGYAVVAPLTEDGRLDATLWRKERGRCRAVRFWAGEPAMFGQLDRKAGGAGGATWFFDFEPDRSDDDEVGHRLELHRFAAGEYITLKQGQDSHVFRIDSVEDFVAEDHDAQVSDQCETAAKMRPRLPGGTFAA
jgi:hypothetical protein